METRDVRRYNMLVRVKEFGATHADLFPAGSVGGTTLVELGAAVDRIDGHAVSQASGRTDAQKRALGKAAARAALRDAVGSIVKMAGGMAVADPEVGKAFQLPVNESDKELVTRAKEFVSSAAPYAAAFVARGLPNTFVADLQGKLSAFEDAINAHATAKQAHINARANISAALDSALAVLQQLDPIVEYRIGSDPGLVAAWQSARRIDKAAVRAMKPAPQPSSPTPERPAAPVASITPKAA